jgi:hypothetical protein
MAEIVGALIAIAVLVVAGASVTFITEPDSREWYLLPLIAPGMLLALGWHKIMGRPARVTNPKFWQGMQKWQDRHPDKPITILNVGPWVLVVGRGRGDRNG